jgi:hypothetical protein
VSARAGSIQDAAVNVYTDRTRYAGAIHGATVDISLAGKRVAGGVYDAFVDMLVPAPILSTPIKPIKFRPLNKPNPGA